MRKFSLLFVLLCFVLFKATAQRVYSSAEFRNNQPEGFSEDNYESSVTKMESTDVNRRLIDEAGNMHYAFVRYANNHTFRPADLDLDVSMNVSTFFSAEGNVRFLVFDTRKFERTDKGYRTVSYPLPQPVENKFRRLFEEFVKEYKTYYTSFRPFVVTMSIRLQKGTRKLEKGKINSLEEATATTQPDTVKQLNFSGLELKSIPEVVYTFKNLEGIELSNNYLTSLPKELTKLKKLKYINANFNELTNDSIAFARNKHVTVVRLQNNFITTLPKTVRKNRRLVDLLIGNNRLGDISTASFRGLKRVVSLNFYNAQINELPAAIKRLKRVEVIDLYHNNLRAVPDDIVRLKKLNTLALANNRIWKLPDNLKEMPGLTHLYVHHNKLSQLPELPPTLKLLHFSHNRFADMPATVKSLSNIEHIDFSSNDIVKLPNELLALPKLKFVFMMGNEYNRKEELFDEVDRFVVALEGKSVTVR